MADTKTTALTENTAPVSTDIMYMVDDPGSSPLSQKMTLATLRTFIKATGGRELISEQTPTGTGTLSWASIPATYKSLEIEYVARGTQAADYVPINIYFNNDTTATNYRFSYDSVAAAGTANTVGMDGCSFGNIAGNNSPSNSCGSAWIKVINYASTTFNKIAIYKGGFRRDAATNHMYLESATVEWESNVAINRVDLTLSAGNFGTGSTLRLYGCY